MTVLWATEGFNGWLSEGEPPLAKAMRSIASTMLRRIVVRSPVLVLFDEQESVGENGTVHEVVARTGMLLRGPVKLLRRTRRPRMTEPAAAANDVAPAGERQRKA
ncbi:MAG: hypothetical protein QM820_19940 [Minicystis sp.]